MNKVTPFLLFNGQAEEAARFYVSVMPGSRIDRITRWPAEAESECRTAEEGDGEVLTVEFTFAGMQFVALNGPQATFTEAVSFLIACADQAEIDYLWAALSAGGSEGPCGWLKDRWGVSWQVAPTRLLELVNDPDRARARRAMEAMMKMSKIDLATIERAAAGG